MAANLAALTATFHITAFHDLDNVSAVVEAHPGHWIFAMVGGKGVGEVVLSTFRWGYAGTLDRPVYNARLETITQKRMWREDYINRRVVVPLYSFYEARESARQFRGNGLLAAAGIYRHNPSDGARELALLTTEADPPVRAYHNRQPVLLPHGMVGDWLSQREKNPERFKEAIYAHSIHNGEGLYEVTSGRQEKLF